MSYLKFSEQEDYREFEKKVEEEENKNSTVNYTEEELKEWEEWAKEWEEKKHGDRNKL